MSLGREGGDVMSVGIGLRELVFELEESGFTLAVSPDKKNIEVTKSDELGSTLLATVNIALPSNVYINDDIRALSSESVRRLLPPIFNYVLSYLAGVEAELGERLTGKSRPQIIKDIVTEDSNHVRQGMIDTLIKSDKLMLLADVYGDKVCRRIDLLSAIKELGYQESTVNGKDLNIIYKGNHVATVNLSKDHSVRRELDWEVFPEAKRIELTNLLKWFIETPSKFRDISFSLLEQVIISNLPKQYKWAYRDEDSTLWAVDDFNHIEKAKKEIICDVSLFKVITKDNPYPTHLGRAL